MNKPCRYAVAVIIGLLLLSISMGYAAAPPLPVVWISGPEHLRAAADSEELVGEQTPATNAVDGDPATFWTTKWFETVAPLPHALLIQLDALDIITAFAYLPRQDGRVNGTIKTYRLYVSVNGKSWGRAVKSGTFSADATEKIVEFTGKLGQYVKLVALTEANDEEFASAAEVRVGIRGNIIPPGPVVPAPRTDVMVDAKGFALQAAITWKNPAADTATSLVVQRRVDHAGEFTSVGDPLPPTATRFMDTEILPDHSYCYRILPMNASGPGLMQMTSRSSVSLGLDPLQGTCLETMSIVIVVPES